MDDDTEFRSRCEWIIPFFVLKYNIFPINLSKKKKSRGGVHRHPRMVRLETLFRTLLDAPDRGISLYVWCSCLIFPHTTKSSWATVGSFPLVPLWKLGLCSCTRWITGREWISTNKLWNESQQRWPNSMNPSWWRITIRVLSDARVTSHSILDTFLAEVSFMVISMQGS